MQAAGSRGQVASAAHAQRRVLHPAAQVSGYVLTRRLRLASWTLHRQQPLGSFVVQAVSPAGKQWRGSQAGGCRFVALPRGFQCRRVCTFRLPAVASSRPTRQSTGPSKAALLPSGYFERWAYVQPMTVFWRVFNFVVRRIVASGFARGRRSRERHLRLSRRHYQCRWCHKR
jgi:hypothetical protein